MTFDLNAKYKIQGPWSNTGLTATSKYIAIEHFPNVGFNLLLKEP